MRDPEPGEWLWFVRARGEAEGLVHLIAGEMEDWDNGLTMCGTSLTFVDAAPIEESGLALTDICRECLWNTGRHYGGDWTARR